MQKKSYENPFQKKYTLKKTKIYSILQQAAHAAQNSDEEYDYSRRRHVPKNMIELIYSSKFKFNLESGNIDLPELNQEIKYQWSKMIEFFGYPKSKLVDKVIEKLKILHSSWDF